jgi:two-component system, NarL family, response regulator NreC
MGAHLHLAPSPDSLRSGSASDSAIRVVLADDHALMRRSLRLLLDREDGVDVIAEAADLTTVIRHVQRHVPHVLVLDLGMPNGSSIEVIRGLREQVPDTEIVVLTMADNPGFAQQALDAGAIGFVLKDHADTELTEAVRGAARGDEYLSPRIAGRLESLRRCVADDKLTVRETEVLRLIALGHTSAEIAIKLHLSRRTVETYRARLHRKLELGTRAELVQYALGRGLLGA